MTSISFGGGTDKAGGFVQPDLPVRGLSRAIGIVGDIDSVVNPPSPASAFDPEKFLAGVLPKLFGLFELTDILALAGLDKAPTFITDQLDKISRCSPTSTTSAAPSTARSTGSRTMP